MFILFYKSITFKAQSWIVLNVIIESQLNAHKPSLNRSIILLLNREITRRLLERFI